MIPQQSKHNNSQTLWGYIDGILPKGPYPPCLRMADRTLLAGYHRYVPKRPCKCIKMHCLTWFDSLCTPTTVTDYVPLPFWCWLRYPIKWVYIITMPIIKYLQDVAVDHKWNCGPSLSIELSCQYIRRSHEYWRTVAPECCSTPSIQRGGGAVLSHWGQDNMTAMLQSHF